MASRKIEDCISELQELWPKIKEDFEATWNGRYSLKLTCTHRPPEEQFELFQKGRRFDIHGNIIHIDSKKIVTNVDGTKILSAHNYYKARAFDVAVFNVKTKRITWDTKFYKPLPEICAKYGLENGGTWTSLKDWPHCQIKDFRKYKKNPMGQAKGLIGFLLATIMRYL